MSDIWYTPEDIEVEAARLNRRAKWKRILEHVAGFLLCVSLPLLAYVAFALVGYAVIWMWRQL